MEDWTDIFSEELKDVEMPLPADDWDVVREKYAAHRRRNRIAAWISGASAVAAALAVFAVLFTGGTDSPADMSLTADSKVPETVAVPDSVQLQAESGEVPESVVEPVQYRKDDSTAAADVEEYILPEKPQEEILVAESDVEGAVNVVRDTSVVQNEVLVADSEPIQKEDEWTQGEWVGDDVPERNASRRRKISVALSGGGVFSGGHLPMPAMDMAPDLEGSFPPFDGPQPPVEDPQPPFGDEDGSEADPPSDTSSFNLGGGTRGQAHSMRRISRNGKQLKSQDMEHYMPVSYGVSARFPLTERLSLNTGVNYTLYRSKRISTYTDGSTETEKQNAHYLGIPLRLDWMVVNRKHFGMYLGVGTQLDRCVYAKVGNERLYDSSFLWSLNGVLGMQYNITDRISLYFEPEITGNLGYPQIRTYRDDAEIMLTARFGLRFNL